ncbi:hypothetical protein [Rhabdochromatium marinum]|uniref:hypothetical protein n=1 Tax=Rhabdochromatium marinum TaxID=48729 RepID=UPI0019035CAD|nr:hypothetical protein [Rhabdochromatium marinum]MBK1650430.1 hypothetical protein [Rhabdochromatium marinum]
MSQMQCLFARVMSHLLPLGAGTGLLLAVGIGFGLTVPFTPVMTAPQLTINGGWIELDVHPELRQIEGRLIAFGTHSDSGNVFATLPPGTIGAVQVALQCMEVTAFQQDRRLTIPLEHCPAQGCALELRWRMDADQWPADTGLSQLDASGYRLLAADVLPRLTAAPDHPLEPHPSLDQATDAPANWQWVIRIADHNATRRGRSAGMAAFRDTWATVAQTKTALAMEPPVADTKAPQSSSPATALRIMQATPCNGC